MSARRRTPRRTTRVQVLAPTQLAPHARSAPSDAEVQGMRTAARLIATTPDRPTFLSNAAEELAHELGQACLVSLLGAPDGGLQPVSIAHARPRSARVLRRLIGTQHAPLSDAFSRAVQRTGGALRMRSGRPRQFRLWLPEAYWHYAEGTPMTSVLAAALRQRRGVVGTLLLWREGDQPAFDAADEAYVVELAARLAQALA